MTTLLDPEDLLGCFFCHKVQPIIDGTYETFSFPIAGIVPVCDVCVDHADLAEDMASIEAEHDYGPDVLDDDDEDES